MAAWLLAAAAILLPLRAARAQERGASALGQLVEGLPVSVRVLVIGAHPDDEDTRLIAWLTKGHHADVAYLSLTRGDGGQNLIGNELGEALGVIRTQELLAARRIDGAHQYFTRAYDFGFSKSAAETFEHWPHDSVLKDVVTVVRAFRPQVIVSVFSGTPRDGHGHHQVAGIVAREAYDVAMDTVRFPRAATAGFGAWTPLKFYRTRSYWRGEGATFSYDAGAYDALLGESYAEIAAESRSQHKSQGFGVLQRKGYIAGSVAREGSRVNAPTDPKQERSIFDGIDTTWMRLAADLGHPGESRSHPGESRGPGAAAVDSGVRRNDNSESSHPGESRGPRAAALDSGVRRNDGWSPDSAFRAAVARVQQAASEARRATDLYDPETGVATLERMRAALADVQRFARERGATDGDVGVSVADGLSRVTRAILMARGIAVDATVERDAVAQGDSIAVQVTVYNRGTTPVTAALGAATRQASSYRRTDSPPSFRRTPESSADGSGPRLAPGRQYPVSPADGSGPRLAPGRQDEERILPDSAHTFTYYAKGGALSQPWWLTTPRAGDMFAVPLNGESDDVRDAGPTVPVAIDGGALVTDAPIVHEFADPVRGEVRRPLAVVPAIDVTLDRTVELARANAPLDRTLRVSLHSASTQARQATVALRLPAGLTADSSARTVSLAALGSAAVTFTVRGRLAAGRHAIGAEVTSDGQRFDSGYVDIDYPHIRPQHLYRRSVVAVEAVDVALPPHPAIAYIPGVGDNVAPVLPELGIAVTMLDPAVLATVNLSRFATIVVGPRAYEASPALVAANARLLDWVRRGGTLVVQYGQYEMTRPGMMPYPITLSRPAARVTVETAPVRVLQPVSPLLRWPNRITSADWDGWVQERSVYMPTTFDPHYSAAISMNDPGEAPNSGAILSTRYGKGMYVYTTLSLLRQVPAGVPGGVRLFVNLLGAGKSR